MRTYNEIKKIRDDLYTLVKIARKTDIGLSKVELLTFKAAVEQYNVVLNDIGEKGVNMNLSLEKGFDETENLLANIRKALIIKGILF